MSGARKRCAYCVDSRSADVDHFHPIKLDYRLAFRWSNLILICPECNRSKGARFPLDSNGQPLLVDPTRTDPWCHLVLDIDTGIIAPRFNGNSFDQIGEATLETIGPINDEATSERRRRAVENYIELFESAATHGDTSELRRSMVKVIKYDDFGLASWFSKWDGSKLPPLREVRSLKPDLWRRFCSLACRQTTNSL
ncbi:HNH endonuclease [Kitasatospora sp. NPDC004799]|uniref:HNH endonuclease n=1 Tax=Kitasatospora sp. NPDC004799 TaxID=3154460 RepID=UPI0033B3DCE7